MTHTQRFIALGAAMLLATGCSGEIRETTTPRTSTEQLLISTAAQRAVKKFTQADKRIKGKRVAIDDSHFVSVDKPYVVSALRNDLARKGAILVKVEGEEMKVKGKPTKVMPELIVELRNGSLGLMDKDFGFGIPPLPLPIPNSNMTTRAPGLWFVYRDKSEGWAKFQCWVYDPADRKYLLRSPDLWGHAYYSTWTILFIGPFDFSNDIYPDDAVLNVE